MASLPANFLALLGQPGAQALYWIEIEGLPYAYGNRSQTSAFWSSLAVAQRFEELRPLLAEVPGGVDARLDPLEGIASPGEFAFRVVDADGFLTQAANVGRDEEDPNALWLTANAAAGATTLNVGGNLAAWPTSGIGYMGRTTFTWTGKGAGTLTGVTLGRFRSPDVLHSQGELVTQYPQHLGLRRCWFYLAMSADGTFAVGDRIARYAGLIEDYALDVGLTTWSLTVRTPEKELGESTTLFRGFRSGRLRSALPRTAGAGTLAGEAADGVPEYERSSEADPGVLRDAATNEVVFEVSRLDAGGGGGFANAEWVYFRIDDEIVLAQWSGTNARFEHVLRGLYGTVVAEHSFDAEWREGTFIVQQDSTGVPEVRYSKFTQGDSPEAILLQLLAGSGTYGVLPESWSAGYDPARLNVASFETLRDTIHAAERLVGWVDEPVSFRDLVVEHLLKPFGLYLVHAPDDTIEVRYLRQGPTVATVATIDATQIVGQPRWKSGATETVGEYRLEADVAPTEGLAGKARTTFIDVFIDAQRLYGKRARTEIHRSIFAHAADGSVVPAGGYRKAQRTFDSRRAYFIARHSRPPPVLSVRVRWSLFHVLPGDTVTLVAAQIPSMSGAARSYSGPAEVVARKPVDKDAAVELDLRLLGVALTRYATVSPAARVASVAGGNITVDAAVFSTGDAAKFAIGDKVVGVGSKFDAVTAVTTITGIAGNVITVSPSIAPAAGDFLVFADYDSQAAAQQAGTHGDLADANERIGTADVFADRYTGM